MPYIYQHKDWPDFHWDKEKIIDLLSAIRYQQGKIIGRMESLGFDLRSEASLEMLTGEIVKSHEIEGDILDLEQVRSSIARRLGMDIPGLLPNDRHIDGIVEMMIDATTNYDQPLTKERLFGWHHALFPMGYSGPYKIQTAQWRTDKDGPMQVVSGAMGKEKVHFEAPSSESIEKEMLQFLDWVNDDQKIDPILKAAVAHLWFITIHPFDDGNGRITRAITDFLLSRADQSKQRFYSMSVQIRNERKQYYEILEKTQKGRLDITNWILWFLTCLQETLHQSEILLLRVIRKAHFWQKHQNTALNERQRKMILRLQGAFFGKLNTSKWAKICKCSQDTALRDINDLIQKGIMEKDEGKGKNTNYKLVE
ncbi:Fic family protein [Algivirga pacifica]|uniref:Fic family protein n=1 Tax=Algivirga pacifica TaxID=1162670 RepID=A0ABP9DM69_9BACT